MKTTVELPDELVRQVKQLVREQGVTMRELIVDGLRREIDRRSRRTTADFHFPTYSGAGDWAPEDLGPALADSYGQRA